MRTEGDKKGAKVQKLAKNEVNTHQHCSFLASLSCQVLMVNIGSLSTGGRVIAVKADLAKIALTTPVCTEVLEKIALSRRCTLEIINRVWIVNLHFQDRQALEVDRLGSNQKRNPCETDGAGIDIHPHADCCPFKYLLGG